jgi:hypothetical protein
MLRDRSAAAGDRRRNMSSASTCAHAATTRSVSSQVK